MKNSFARYIGIGLLGLMCSCNSKTGGDLSPIEKQKREIIKSMNYYLESKKIQLEHNQICTMDHIEVFDGDIRASTTDLRCQGKETITYKNNSNRNNINLSVPYRVVGIIEGVRVDINQTLSLLDGCLEIKVSVKKDGSTWDNSVPSQTSCPPDQHPPIRFLPTET